MKLSEVIQETMNAPPKLYNQDGSEFLETQLSYQKIKSYLAINCIEDEVVGIILVKDPIFFLTILACMELGIPYVPMSMNFPKIRIQEIIEDAKIRTVLDTETLAKVLEVRTFKYINSKIELKKFDENSPLYILFTSGSSGRPKGVVISRGAFIALDIAQNKFLETIQQSSNLLQVTEFTFDICLVDFLLFLRKKANIYFSNFSNNVFQLAQEIDEHRIDFLCTVPNTLSLMLSENMITRTNYRSLKTIILIGSRVTEGLYYKLAKYFPNELIINGYGPTEFTVYSHAKKFKFKNHLDLNGINVSVGGTLSMVRSEIISNGRILSEFEKGELCLAGPQLMSEYKGDISETKRVFIKIDGELFYKTGDIAYRDNKNEYYIVGRLDDTIKYCGYRINLLDINSYISKLRYIEDVCTLSVPDEIKENITLSFIVTNDKNITEVKVREDLSKIILDYQIPQEIIFLDSLPTNLSGKIDRKELVKYYKKLID